MVSFINTSKQIYNTKGQFLQKCKPVLHHNIRVSSAFAEINIHDHVTYIIGWLLYMTC